MAFPRLNIVLNLVVLVALLLGQFSAISHVHLPEVSGLEVSVDDHDDHHGHHEEDNDSCSLCELAAGADSPGLLFSQIYFISETRVTTIVSTRDSFQVAQFRSQAPRAPPYPSL